MKQLSLLKKLLPHFANPFVWVAMGILPCLLTICYTISSHKRLDRLEEKAFYLKKRMAQVTKQREKEQALAQKLKNADPEYVEKQLETLCFLSDEIKRLQALTSSDQEGSMAKRLGHLQGDNNHLHFKQDGYTQVGRWQEVRLIQRHPVEVNEGDLKTLLSRVENFPDHGDTPSLRSPYLIIEECELLRKSLPSSEQHFLINLKLLKREQSHE